VSLGTQEHGSFGEYSVSAGSAHRFALPSASEMGALDRETIQAGISGLELMERAGVAIAQRTREVSPSAHKFLVLCGPGNNGGDGLVIGRYLRDQGLEVSIVIASAGRYSSECLEQLSRVHNVRVFGGASPRVGVDGAGLAPITRPELRELVAGSDVVFDALLGTGQREAPRGAIDEMVQVIRAARVGKVNCRVVAVDLPTGIDGDTGAQYESHIAADLTFAVQCIKRGLMQFPARRVCGRIITLDIGIKGSAGVEYSLVATENLPKMLPRPADAHKGMLGGVLVIGGSLSMPGAPMLSALGALRCGAGIVSRCVRRGWTTIPPLPEAMFEVLSGDSPVYHPSDAVAVAEMASRYDVCVIGPGLGTDPATADFLVQLCNTLRSRSARVIVDADALNLIATAGITLKGIAAIVTPHPGEAARLLGVANSEVQRDRFTACRQIARQMHAICVLKGAGTLVHDGGEGKVIADGTPYLATPGSGDVLAGILAACAVRTRSLWEAAILGVWLHARAGMAAAEKRGGPILASEIAEDVGGIVGDIEKRCMM
jgi:hydroxyethylthiazole kinase-like uncharacterized protein yjeF